ncbi:MAG: M48 family metalloprotease [Myxococcus sp.]|nr:M48 family metalloprotease [Myxococcus sp.]
MEPLYTAEQLAEVKAYHQPRYVASFVDFVLTPLVLALMVRFATRPLWRLSERVGGAVDRLGLKLPTRLWGGTGWAAALAFATLFFGAYGLLDVPLEIGFGYFHEHAYGLSRTSPAVFIVDFLKGKLLFAGAVGALVFGLFGLARRTRHWWWLLGVTASVLMLLSTAIDPYRSRVYVEQTPLTEGSLRERITSLMAKADIDFRDVLVEHTASRSVRLQAYFAGSGPTRTIVLNDALLAALTEDEVLASVAHEAGHVNEPRWPGRLASSGVLVAFLFAVERLFRRAVARGWFGITERADVRTLPVIVLTFTLGLMLGNPVSGAVSREREYAADRYGVALTQDVGAFRAMLVKAARTNKMDPDPPRWAVLRGMSHPPIGERIAALEFLKP